MDLDELEHDGARVTVTYKGKTAHVEYRPLKVSLTLQRAMAGLATPPHDPGPLVDQLATVVTSWDLARGGEAVPITVEGIGSLPIELGLEVARAIMEDFRDPKSLVSMASRSVSSTPSPATSAPAGDSATAPTSPSPSSTPAGQAPPPGTSTDSPALTPV